MNDHPSKSTGDRILKISIGLAYLCLLIYLLFLAPYRTKTPTVVNLIPFGSIVELTRYTFITGNDVWHWFLNVPGNILAFVPLPYVFQIFRKTKFNFWWAFFPSAAIPLIIEIAQYYFQTGSCDVDDWILNFSGMMIGFVLVRKSQKQSRT